jgi:hypothetical protein
MVNRLVKINLVLVSMVANKKIGSLRTFSTATDTKRLCLEYYLQVNYCKYGNGAKYVGVVYQHSHGHKSADFHKTSCWYYYYL